MMHRFADANAQNIPVLSDHPTEFLIGCSVLLLVFVIGMTAKIAMLRKQRDANAMLATMNAYTAVLANPDVLPVSVFLEAVSNSDDITLPRLMKIVEDRGLAPGRMDESTKRTARTIT